MYYLKDGTYDMDSQYKLIVSLDDANTMISHDSLNVATALAFVDNSQGLDVSGVHRISVSGVDVDDGCAPTDDDVEQNRDRDRLKNLLGLNMAED